MHKSTKTLIAGGTLAALLSGAGLAQAHRAELDGHSADRQDCGHGSHHRLGQRWFGSAKHMDGKLAFIKAELKITPEQEAAWEQFAGSLKDLAVRRADVRSQLKRDRNGDATDVIQRMEIRLAMIEAQMTDLRRVSEQFKALYGKLDSEQREVVDSLRPIRHL